jgi:hypothetical protein
VVSHSRFLRTGERTQSGPQGYVLTVGDESHKDVRFDAMLELVKNGP